LTDSDHVRSLGNLPTGTGATDLIPDTRLREHFATAALTLKRWVGTAVYAEALALVAVARAALTGGQNLTENGNLGIRETALRTAEGYLVLAAFYPSLNLITPGRGVMAGVATEAGGDVRARNPAEIKEIAAGFRREARMAVKDYLANTGIECGISYARDEAGNRRT